MSFLSPGFFLFFPLVALVWFLLPAPGRRPWLLLASWWFLLCAGPEHLAFLLAATVLTYAGARLLDRAQGGRRKAALVLLLLLLFGTLFLFKYLAFSLSLLERLLQAAGLAFTSPALELLLPAGLSFYLFMAAGYLIDVYRRDRPAEGSFLDLALFLSFFPYLLSGPIGRAGGLLPQFRRPAPFSWDGLRQGALRFLWGAFKKLVIADRLGILVSTVYAAPDSFGRLQVMAAALAFSIQIYCDFSAYSDMALGCAQAMGFHLMENFRTPYFARSIGEFWRRWHISLSSWFRDYLYIPLGGSYCSKLRTNFNKFVVFLTTGLWHGANWTFVLWGLWHGLFSILEDVGIVPARKLEKGIAGRIAGHIYVMLVVILGFVLFRAETLGQAGVMFSSMFTGFDFTPEKNLILHNLLSTTNIAMILLAVLFSVDWLPRIQKRIGVLSEKKQLAWSAAAYAAVFILFIYDILNLSQATFNPFIYFQF